MRGLSFRPFVVAAMVLGLGVFPAGAQRFHFEAFTPENGLAASSVFQIHQDDQGHLWVGTSEGLSRYDGIGFTTFDVSTGLADQRIYSIVRDNRGVMWLGTEQGVSAWNGTTVKNYSVNDGLGAGTVWSMATDEKGRVLLGTQMGGLTVYDGTSFQTFTTADGLPSNDIVFLQQDSRGRTWISSYESGITLLEIDDAGQMTVLDRWTESDGLVGYAVVLLEEEDGSILAGTRGGGLQRITVDGQLLRLNVGLDSEDIYSLMFNNRGRLVIGTLGGGAGICSPPGYEKCQKLTKDTGLPTSDILSLLEDRDGNLWLGSDSGLYRWPGHQFILYTELEGLVRNRVLGVRPGFDDDVWLSTTGGLTRLVLGDAPNSKMHTMSYTTEDGLPSNETWDSLVDRNGRLWVATQGGLCFSDDRRTFTVVPVGLSSEYILTLFEDRKGSLWVGTAGGAARLVKNPTDSSPEPLFERLTTESGVAGLDVYAIDEASDGTIWLATNGGVNSWDGARVRSYTEQNGLPVETINDVLVGSDDVVWLATSGAGLVRLEPDNDSTDMFSSWGTSSGLPSNAVISITEDNDGMLWVGTLAGIVKIDPLLVAPGRNPVVAYYTVDDGIGSHDPGTGNSFARGSIGDLWFGLTTGATRYLPFGARPTLIEPTTTIESVTANDKRVFGAPFSTMTSETMTSVDGDIAQLPARTRELAIEYRGIALNHQKEINYQVQLDGWDEAWSAPTRKTSRQYTNLPPGEYSFLVRARRTNGEWGEPARIQLSIPAAFWQELWFQILLGVAVIGLMTALHRFRTFRIRRHNEALELLVAERTADLESRSQELEEANQLIREADQAKSQFLANMSHELRTPLNSIIGFTELLLERGDRVGSSKLKIFLSNVRFSAKHLLSLINDVLDLSKVEAGRMEVHVDRLVLPELVEHVVLTVSGLASPKDVEIVRDVPDLLPLVYMDAPKVRQILYNLLSNAIKFSPKGTSVNIGVRRLEKVESTLGCDTIELSVSDSGPGIPPDELKTIFEAYKQAKNASRLGLGTGLGLAIVKRFAEIQGGAVLVESAPGEGSRFRVLIPCDARATDTEGDLVSNFVVVR